jgi:hydroxypyruvate isomerase
MMIKQSITDWSCFMGANAEADPLTFYRQCRELGFSGAEMVPPSRRSAAREAGLSLLNLIGPGVTDGLNRLENHEALLPEIVKALDEAKDHGIGAVIIFSGNRNGQADHEGIANCATGLRQIVPHARRTGVELHFEMFNGYDHVDYQADHGCYGFALIDAVGSDYLKLLYDVYHMERAGDDFMADIAAHIREIGHFHCAAAPSRTCTAESKTANYRKIVERAIDQGYNGYFGQEFLIRGDVLEELKLAYNALATTPIL